jgi:hypothetical protein
MKSTNDELILYRLNQLMFIIDKLPFSADTRKFINYCLATDFHHSWQFNEEENEFAYSEYIADHDNPQFANVKTTCGIQNIQQLNRYIKQFISFVKYINQNVLLDFINTPVEHLNDFYFRNSDVDFRKLSKYEFLKIYKLNFISDLEIDSIVRCNFGSSFPYQTNDIARRKHLPGPINYLNKAMILEEQNIFQVEELEFLLCFRVIDYFNSGNTESKSKKNDSQYFNNFISTSLFDQFIIRSNEKVSNMTILESSQYFEKSLIQFETYKPEYRIDEICKKIWLLYSFHEKSPKSINAPSLIFITSVVNIYNLYFDKFKNFTEELSRENSLKSCSNTLNSQQTDFDDDICLDDFLPKIILKKEELFTFKFNDYLIDWVNCNVTLDQWLKYPKLDVFHHLERFPISAKEWKRIRDHQFCLFNEHSENIFNSTFRNKFENLKQNDKVLIANRDISLITNMISRTITKQEEDLIKSIFPALNWQTTAKELENIIYSRYESLENYDINKTPYDEFWSYANSMAIYKYKEYLSEFISDYENPHGLNRKKSDVSKARIFSSDVAYTYIHNQNNSPAITVLLSSLKNKKFISDKNGITDFRKIFDNQLPDKLIIWTGTFGELHHFILLMHHEYKVIKKISNIWKVTAELFVDENLTKYDASKFHLQPLPARMSELIKIVERLKLEPGK